MTQPTPIQAADSSHAGYLAANLPTPLEDAALDAFFANLISGVPGIAIAFVRPRWQPTAPEQPPITVDWCAIGVTEQASDEYGYTGRDPSTGGYWMSEQEYITLSCSFYGPNARSNASILRGGMRIAQNQEQLYLNGFGFTKCGPIMNLSTMINNQWYQRREIMLYLQRVVARTYNVLDLLSSSGTVSSETNSVTYQTKEISG